MDNYSTEQIEDAQKALDKLCKQYEIKPFLIDRKRGGDWKKLVMAMCGLEPPKSKKSGCKKKYSDEDIWRIGQLIDIEHSFGTPDKDGNDVEPPPMVKQLFILGVKELDQDVTEEAVRGIWNRYLQMRKKNIEDLSKELPS